MWKELVVAAVIISIVVGACASFSTAISQDCEGLQDTFGLAKDTATQRTETINKSKVQLQAAATTTELSFQFDQKKCSLLGPRCRPFDNVVNSWRGRSRANSAPTSSAQFQLDLPSCLSLLAEAAILHRVCIANLPGCSFSFFFFCETRRGSSHWLQTAPRQEVPHPLAEACISIDCTSHWHLPIAIPYFLLEHSFCFPRLSSLPADFICDCLFAFPHFHNLTLARTCHKRKSSGSFRSQAGVPLKRELMPQIRPVGQLLASFTPRQCPARANFLTIKNVTNEECGEMPEH